ncbi:hypothetical protein ACFQU7_43380 [Pseudoroseomonas wenyumeiae]
MSASETHNRKNLNRSIDDSLQGFPAVAERLRQGGIEVLGAMAVAFGCPFEGDVPLETVLRIARTYAELGVRHITLGDTTGMATPRNIRATLRALRAELPEMEFTLHLHNTRGVGLANVLVGLEEGAAIRFRCRRLGRLPFAAGATGNICTEDLVYLLHESGLETGIDLEKTIAIAHRMERLLGKPLAGQVMRAGPRLRLHAADAVPTAAG